MQDKFDYIVIGSGFGGSVSAMRLAEKGYSVLVIEKGKRWKSSDFPSSNWNIRKYLWIPLLKCFGFQKLSFFKEVFVISGVGVGGGSLVYANTHMMPRETFYANPIWSHFKDWKSVLAPYFETARFMLGREKFKKEYEEDRVLKSVAEDMGRAGSYNRVDYVGVYLGDTKKEIDPYFKGLGPKRTGCIECAGCMVGCRHNAKNTLDKNYLWFAEHLFAAKLVAETIVDKIEVRNGEYFIHTKKSTSWFGKEKKVYTSNGLVVSGGVLGTLDLLLKQKHLYKTLPGLSDKLGENILTNSEMLSGVVAADRKLNHGIAISSVFNPDDNTHIELRIDHAIAPEGRVVQLADEVIRDARRAQFGLQSFPPAAAVGMRQTGGFAVLLREVGAARDAVAERQDAERLAWLRGGRRCWSRRGEGARLGSARRERGNDDCKRERGELRNQAVGQRGEVHGCGRLALGSLLQGPDVVLFLFCHSSRRGHSERTARRSTSARHSCEGNASVPFPSPAHPPQRSRAGWQCRQKKVLRAACTMRTIFAPQRRQSRPARS